MARTFGHYARFEVRLVDAQRCAYVRVSELFSLYHDACLMADAAGLRSPGADFIVWDTVEDRIVYDSRLLKKPLAPV